MRYAVLNDDGVVINVILADHELPGLIMIQSDMAQVGDVQQPDGSFARPPAVVVVPAAISAVQARLALNRAGLREAAETAIAQADQDVRDLWEYAATLHRDHPVLRALAAAVGLTDAQLDDLFIQAATL